jgi:hypothetical protein
MGRAMKRFLLIITAIIVVAFCFAQLFAYEDAHGANLHHHHCAKHHRGHKTRCKTKKRLHSNRQPVTVIRQTRPDANTPAPTLPEPPVEEIKEAEIIFPALTNQEEKELMVSAEEEACLVSGKAWVVFEFVGQCISEGEPE